MPVRDEREGARERRTVRHEIRVLEGDKGPIVEGYAAVFDEWSDDLWWFREKIRQGAFSKTIQEADVRALWNHDPNLVLGRTGSGTLELWEDEVGLGYRARPPDTQWARDALVTMRRGDVDQSSFGFEVVRDEWGEAEDSDLLERELIEVRLWDVSPVTFPAYPQTSVQVRARLPRPQRPRLLRPQRAGPRIYGATRGEGLARVLNEAIADVVDDDTSESDVIAEMAREAGISAGTVGEILGARIDCPPVERLEGFARVLDVSADALISAAEGDGCTYDGRAAPPRAGHPARGHGDQSRARLDNLRRRVELEEQQFVM